MLTAVGLLASAGSALAASSNGLHFCDRPVPLTAAQQDRLLQYGAIIRRTLDARADQAAVVARSGTDLSRFGLRYSHAAIAMRDAGGDATPWTVRQLYYACDEGRARIFDQGMAGFVSGTDDADTGYTVAWLLPPVAASSLRRAVLDKPLALALQSGRYSANAYTWGLKYQNCNQWVLEMLAAASAGLQPSPQARAQAQAWLKAQPFEPAPVDLRAHWLKFAAGFVPFIHLDDHPEDERYTLSLHTTVPLTLQAWLQSSVPGIQRIEFCHADGRVVVRHGWRPLPEGCRAEDGDEVIDLDGAVTSKPAPAPMPSTTGRPAAYT